MVKKQKMIKYKLEHKTRPLLPFRQFMVRVIGYFLFSLLLIAFSLGIGTFGYHYFGEISWIDAFYNASMILTGMGPVNEMIIVKAKLFFSFYALFSGIAFLSTVAVIFAPIAHIMLLMLHFQDYEND